MIEKLVPLAIPPGMFKNGTDYQAKGRWVDGNLVRFANQTIAAIGGWRRLTDSSGSEFGTLTGCPRGALAYRGNDGAVRLAVGTVDHLYIVTAGALFDLTPADLTEGSCAGSYADGSGVYGAGVYGAGPYGGASLASTLSPADTWSLDNFGDYLVGVLTSDGRILVWDADTGNDAAEASGAPSDNRAVFVTTERFLTALGAGGNPRLVQWASRETTDDWTASASNSAGAYELATAGVLMAGRRTRKQNLLWTSVDLWTMTFLSTDEGFGFEQVGDTCGLIGPNAVAANGSDAFWMGAGAFFRFDGYVQEIPCDVADYVFSDINRVQAALIHCQTIAEKNEVWWFYPSEGSTENDRAVVYNYAENHWTTHSLARSTGVDKGVVPSPILVSDDGTPGQGVLYEHETDAGNHASVTPYLTSGPLEIGDGDRIMRIQNVVPDENTRGDLAVRFRTKIYPTDTEDVSTLVSLDDASPIPVRIDARQVKIELREATATDWRMGMFRFGVRPQGRR